MRPENSLLLFTGNKMPHDALYKYIEYFYVYDDRQHADRQTCIFYLYC